MNVEPLLFTVLSPLVGGRVFADVAPQGAALPRIVYQQVGGEAPAFLERGLPSKKNGRYQMSVWAQRRDDAAEISDAIELALVMATEFQARPLGARIAVFDEDTDLRGYTQDFTIWSER